MWLSQHWDTIANTCVLVVITDFLYQCLDCLRKILYLLEKQGEIDNMALQVQTYLKNKIDKIERKTLENNDLDIIMQKDITDIKLAIDPQEYYSTSKK